MSAFDRMKQVRTLLDYSNRRANDTIDYTKLINDSRDKVVSILNKRSIRSAEQASIVVKQVKPMIILSEDSNKSLHEHFKSMVNLTNYLMYDVLTPQLTTQLTPIFSMDRTELASMEYFATEIDSIQNDLLDISYTIKKMQDSYRIYCENLLRLCDQKDVLFDLFLDYYEEYFVRDQLKLKSSSSRKQAAGAMKKAEKTAEKRNNNATDNDDDNEDDTKKRRSHLLRRKSSVYTYGVPTENRFAILSKTESGTLIRHF